MIIFLKRLALSLAFIFTLSLSQLSLAQTPYDWFEFFNNGLGGEDARQPGANNSDVEVCKEFIEQNGVFPNLGKCANMTPADLQFVCNNPFVQIVMLTDSKGECVKEMMKFMSDKKRSG